MTLKEAQNIMGLRDEELIVDGCKVTTEYDEVYFKCKAENLKAMSVSVILTRTLLMKWQIMKNGTATHIVRMAMR